jgi:flagellar M-ring protein FliF
MAVSRGIAEIWNARSVAARMGLVGGMMAIAVLAIAAVIWSMQADYRILFSNLSDTDAAAIVTELKHSKTAYRLSDGGATIRVPADRVYETRLALMSSGAPLSGGVGFEIFDKQGLGATEQSQRVSYQRALQGELSRTISALEHVRQAHVLLAMPESSLFRRDRQEARAAVSLIMQPGPSLEREQIAGIQRLVAASVTGLDPARVVVTDQRGVTLSGPDSLTGPGGVGGNRLAMKREIEEYFTRKVADLLESAYGPGQVIVSVDVALNFDEIHRTVQNLLPVPPAASNSSGDGGVRRKRQVITGGPQPDDGVNAAPNESTTPRPASSSTDVEYEYGRRVEQVIASPGSIEQMSVGVVVRGQLTPEKQARIAQLVHMAAGLNDRRGDGVTVQPLETIDTREITAPGAALAPQAVSAVPAAPVEKTPQRIAPFALSAGLACIAAILAAVLFMLWRREPAAPRLLTAAERANLLAEIQQTFTPAPQGRAP